MAGAEAGGEAFAETCFYSGSGGFDDAVAADDEGAVDGGEFLDGFGHAVVEDVALFFVVALEGIEDHLFGLFEDLLVVADDEKGADFFAFAAVAADLEGEGEDAVEDGAFDVFVDAGLLGGVEEFVFAAEGHDDEGVDETPVGAGEEDDGVSKVDDAIGEADDGGEFDLAEAVEFDFGDGEYGEGGIGEFGDSFFICFIAGNENGAMGDDFRFGEGVDGDDDGFGVYGMGHGGCGTEEEVGDAGAGRCWGIGGLRGIGFAGMGIHGE